MVKIGEMELDLDDIVKETGYSEEFLKSEILNRYNNVSGNLIESIEYICGMARANSLVTDKEGGDNG